MAITYTPTTNFGLKDSLPTNDPAKVIKGAEFSTEFTAIQTAFGQAAPLASPTFTGTATFNNVTATGTVTLSSVNVNGTVTADGLTVDGNLQFNVGAGTATFSIADLGYIKVTHPTRGGDYRLQTNGLSAEYFDLWSGAEKLVRFSDNGDISFYEETGTTEKFFWDASEERLGIGTTSPANLLHVAGSSAGALEVARFRLEGATNNPMLKIEADEANQTAGLDVSGSTATEFTFSVGGTERARIDGNGNLGIGTPSPNAMLELFASNNGATENNTLRITDGDTFTEANQNVGRIEFFGNDASGAGSGVKGALTVKSVGLSGDSYLTLSTASTSANDVERLRIDSSGRLLINQTSNVSSLTLQSTAPSGFSVGSGFYSASTQSTIEFKDSNTTANYKVRIGSETDDMVMFAGGSERVRLDASGNLGIGTTNPASKLSIAAGDILLDNTRSIIFKDSGGTARGILQYFSDNSTYLDAPNGSTVFRNGAGNTEKMRIDSSGNALIGTTAVTGSLSNTARVTGGIFSTNNGTTSVPNATWTTLTAIPTGDAIYLVTAYLPNSGDPAGYNAVSIVTTSLTGTNLVDIKNANQVALRMSGSNFQVNHGQGTTQPINWSILRLA